MICNICPHKCDIEDGHAGKCLVRKNINNSIVNAYHGQIANLCVDSIEKRPFFHFYPGTKYLSVAMLGCSMSCDYCQNYKISQSVTSSVKTFTPHELDALRIDKQCHGIAFSFNEPTIHWEFVFETCNLTPGLSVVKTNGFAEKWVFEELCSVVGAFNVDIKGNDADYKNVCRGGILKHVLDTVSFIHKCSHLEISYLPLPERIMDFKFHSFVRDFLSDLSAEIPLHLLYFYPFHRLTQQEYTPSILHELYRFFREKLDYVYVSNIFDSSVIGYRNTKCYHCNSVLIERTTGKTIVRHTSCCSKTLKGFFDSNTENKLSKGGQYGH